MMRSMFAGVSGLRNHQIRLDVIGNNIANVNTVGFKGSRVNFQDLFYQTLRGAARPQGNLGGTNPQQVGLGMSVSSIDTIHTQGNLQNTGKMTDLAIQGNGFFVLTDGGQKYYTRAGNFDLDESGNLINPSGLKVMGWAADNSGVFPTRDESNLTTLKVAVGQSISAQATTKFAYTGNLDANATAGPPPTTVGTSINIYDSLGRSYNLTVTFTKTSNPNEWDYTIADPSGKLTLASNTGTIQFDTNGVYDAAGSTVPAMTVGVNDQAATAGPIQPDFSKLTQFAEKSTAQASSRDGYPMGFLTSFTIDASGVITGVYSNGLNQAIGQIAVSNFANPGGLLKSGENLFMESNNSGLRQIGEAGAGGRGSIAPANLEMSNVDLSQQFTDMITTQRGFQANTRVITASDQMLQELVNLIR